MKRFITIDGCIIAIDAIEMIFPASDGKVVIRFKSGQVYTFEETSVKKLMDVLFPDLHLL